MGNKPVSRTVEYLINSSKDYSDLKKKIAESKKNQHAWQNAKNPNKELLILQTARLAELKSKAAQLIKQIPDKPSKNDGCNCRNEYRLILRKIEKLDKSIKDLEKGDVK